MTEEKSFADGASDHGADDSPRASPAPGRRRWAAFLKRRWPTGAGIAAAIVFAVLARVLGDDFLAWSVLVMALIYLVWGAARGALRRRGPLMIQTSGVIGFGAIALAALYWLYVDPDLGRYVLAVGWFGHAAWDAAHHIAKSKVVARWWPEFCGVADLLVGFVILFA